MSVLKKLVRDNEQPHRKQGGIAGGTGRIKPAANGRGIDPDGNQFVQRVGNGPIEIKSKIAQYFQHTLVSVFWMCLSLLVLFVVSGIYKSSWNNLLIAIVIIFILLLLMNRRDIRRIKAIWINEGIKLSVIALISGNIILGGLNGLSGTYKAESSLNQNYGDYRFYLDVDPTNYDVYGYNLLLYYDFSANEGNLSFEIDSDTLKNKAIMFGYPDAISVTNISISGATAKNHTSNDYGMTWMTIDSFNFFSNESTYIPFLLKLKSKNIEPKGKFLFETNFGRISNQAGTYTNKQYFYKTMEFYLGDYNCVVPCYDYDSSWSYVKKEGNYLRVFMPSDYYKDVPHNTRLLHQEVSLNTINELSAKSFQDAKNIELGLLVGGVLLFIERLADFVIKFAFNVRT